MGLQEFGVSLFKKVFLTSPDLVSYFPFKNVDNMWDSQVFIDHAYNVSKSIGTAVEHIQDLENLTPYLKDLGSKHKKFGVLKQHYPLFQNAIILTIEELLEHHFTDEVKKAWQIIGNLISETMISDNYCSQNQTDIDSKSKSNGSD